MSDEIRITPAALAAAARGDVANAVVAMTPGGIEAQEAAGQATLCRLADRLPVRGTIDSPAKRAEWESAGFVFGSPIKHTDGREVFVACKFPIGWSLVPADDHAMWSSVIDSKGRKRAAVFFKAAFYDYNAHTFGLSPRYDVNTTGPKPVRVGVFDDATGACVFEAARFDDWQTYYAGDNEAARRVAKAWLAEHFPLHESPLAYWED